MFSGNFPNSNHDAENNMKDTREEHNEDMTSLFTHHYLHCVRRQQQQQYQQLHRRELPNEVDSSRSSEGGGETTKKTKPTSSSEGKRSKDMALVVFGGKDGERGATVEVAKRPRGRPRGSKNKPKAPVIITREVDPNTTMRLHVLEIPGGHDVVSSLIRFCHCRNLGICVLAGSGAVANVALRQPSIIGTLTQGGAQQVPPPPSGASPVAFGFHGRFEILSMSAIFLPQVMDAISPAASGILSISLSGPQGQIVGGKVAGPLMTDGTVVVVAAAYFNPTFHRLAAEDDVSASVPVKTGDGTDVEVRDQHAYHHHQKQNQQQSHHGTQAVAGTATAEESCGMRIYSGHLPTEVMWPPTAHPPPPPPY